MIRRVLAFLAVARGFVRGRKTIVLCDGYSYCTSPLSVGTASTSASCLSNLYGCLEFSRHDVRDPIASKIYVNYGFLLLVLADKNELEAAQNFLEQAAQTNLVSSPDIVDRRLSIKM